MRKLVVIGFGLSVLNAIAAEPALDCATVASTPEIKQCLSQDLEAAEAVMSRYLAGSRERLVDDMETVSALELAQVGWKEYRDLHCASVYSLWRGGTIRGAMYRSCQIELTSARTRELWAAFLVNGEGNAPAGFPDPAE